MKTALFIALAAVCPAQTGTARIATEVRHELALLPNHGVFDNLDYRVEGRKVTLFGQVTSAKLKSSAEQAVKKVEGVEAVVNQLEVLPASDGDDRIRQEAFHKLYASRGLERYQYNAVAGIHIVVKNGDVTLVGAVENETDKNLAGAAVNGIVGVGKVTNRLIVAR